MKKTRFEGVIRRIVVCVVNREKNLAKHHMKRILPYYDEMTDVEKEVVDELKLRLFCWVQIGAAGAAPIFF